MTHDLSIADKCIKEDVYWQNNPNTTRDIRQNYYSEAGRQIITLPEGIGL